VRAFDVRAFDVIVIGGGAAADDAPLTAGQRGRQGDAGSIMRTNRREILISGGRSLQFPQIAFAPDR